MNDNSPVVVLVDPNSSGPYLARAFQENGARTCHVYNAQWKDEAAQERLGDRVVLHEEDVDETLSALSDLRPVAVLTCAESGVTLADRLAAEWGLDHNDPTLSAARCDKDLALRAVADAGLPTGQSYLVDSKEALKEAGARIGSFPLVIKPKDSAGSDGLHICDSLEDALAAFHALMGQKNVLHAVNSAVLVQEFIDGQQYMVNTVSIDGRHVLSEFYVQRIDMLPGVSISRHLRSRRSLSDVDTQVVDYTLACLDALGVRHGPAHSEIRMTSSGPRLIEINPRLMGRVMMPDPYYGAFGYSPQDLVVERYLRPERFRARLDERYAPAQSVARSYLRVREGGTVSDVHNLHRIRSLPGFHSLHGVPRRGTVIRDPQMTTTNSGTVYFAHADESTVENSLTALHELEDAGAFFGVRS